MSLEKQLRLAKDPTLTKDPFEVEILEVFEKIVSQCQNQDDKVLSGLKEEHKKIKNIKIKYGVPLKADICKECPDFYADFSFLSLPGTKLLKSHPKCTCFLDVTLKVHLLQEAVCAPLISDTLQ